MSQKKICHIGYLRCEYLDNSCGLRCDMDGCGYYSYSSVRYVMSYTIYTKSSIEKYIFIILNKRKHD